ncbi:MAG: HD domain-containing protein, partial [Thermoflexales bacterium]|nr:HD domain-containing protein [Thermoflexales bacterium]
MVQVNTPDYETILEQVTRDGGQAGRALVERAYALAQFAHNGQQRESGEPFFTHCLTVAGILSELNMDPATIAAAFLHDVVEDT